ncbi:MAG: alpha-galactosidase [Pseudomonadota bacterium]
MMTASADLGTDSAWRIDSAKSSGILTLQRGMPRLCYWGNPLERGISPEAIARLTRRPAVPGALDEPEALTLVPEAGTGYGAHPGLVVSRDGETLTTQLQVTGVDIDEHRLAFDSEDLLAGVRMRMTIGIDPDSHTLYTENTLINLASEPLALHWLTSMTLPLPDNHTDCLLLSGRWAQEFQMHRVQHGVSAHLMDNRRGRTSHDRFPGLISGSSGFSAERGQAIAAHLAWSGNHRLLLDRARDGQPLVQMGVLANIGELTLRAGQRWTAPRAYAAHSGAGYNVCMQRLHTLVRRRILRAESFAKPRPVHFNTWEAMYFAQSEQRTLALVEEARSLGAERFVLDDGWFEGRIDDASGLGNWRVCSTKYPNGLEPIFAAVESAGMQKGLWIEPEMVNADSDVYREHPDWILAERSRVQPLGRHQYALNLCRDDVFANLLENISDVVARYGLDYLKWDMNRDLVHATDDLGGAGVRWVEAFYRLADCVRERFSALEIEICASGGARADYAALARGDRIWTSDNHDPHDRQRIQNGFSLFFPPEIMGSHIGSATSEITGRHHALAFRVATALIGHLGIEPSREALTEDERASVVRACRWFKDNRSWLHSSSSYFADHPEPSVIVRCQVATDRSRALMVVALLDTPMHGVIAPARCLGLQANAVYEVNALDVDDFSAREVAALSGEILGQVGLQPAIMRPDSALLYEFTRRQ